MEVQSTCSIGFFGVGFIALGVFSLFGVLSTRRFYLLLYQGREGVGGLDRVNCISF